MSRQVTTFYYVELDAFDDLIISAGSIRSLLEAAGWANALTIEENVYPNLVRVFYSNMEISASRQNRLIINVGGVPIEFDIADLNRILGTLNKGFVIYTSSKDLHFNHFRHADGVRNICRRKDLTDDICSLFFRSHLLPLSVIILYSILQHVVTLR